MSFFSTSNKNHDGFHVVVEILDRSVELSLLAVKAGSFGEVANVSLKHRIVPDNGLTESEIEKFSKILSEAFKLLAEEARKKVGPKNKIKIKNAVAVIFYPWFVSEKKEDIHIGKDDKPIYVKAKDIEEALNTTRLDGLEENHAIAAYAYKKSIIETFVNYIKLNGYTVANPIGKKAKNVSVGACFYTASSRFLDCLKKEISFHTDTTPKIITFPRACAMYASLFKLESPSLFINIEEATTSICSVSKESVFVYKAEAFDMGLDKIVENVMEKGGFDKEVALSYIRLLDEKLLSDDISILVKESLDDALSAWKSKVQHAMREAGPPSEVFGNRKIILCRDSKFGGIFEKALNQDSLKNDFFDRKVDISKVIFESSLFGV